MHIFLSNNQHFLKSLFRFNQNQSLHQHNKCNYGISSNETSRRSEAKTVPPFELGLTTNSFSEEESFKFLIFNLNDFNFIFYKTYIKYELPHYILFFHINP